MERKLSDHAFKFIVLIIGIIIVVDIANVFVIGGPSVFTLIFKPGNTISTSEIVSSSAGNTNLLTMNASANAIQNETGGTVPVVQKAANPSGTIQAIYVPTKATPVPTVHYVTVVTPIQTGTVESSQFVVRPTPQAIPEQDEYVPIYSEDLSYITTSVPTAVAFSVVNPPLVINFTVSPVMVKDIMAITNNTQSNKGREELINVTRPSEFSSFTVIIFDRETGKEIDRDGYGGVYDRLPDSTYSLREAGSYLIQFEGANTNVHVTMFLKKKGNIE